MTKTDLLKRLLPGFLPILVFIVVDELWGTFYGLVVALAVGVVELLYTFLKERKVDRFVIFDVCLLLLLGGVSLALDNELFFKLKPGAVSLLMTVLIGFAAFVKPQLLMGMMGRYTKGIEFNPYQLWEMQQSMKRITWLLLFFSLGSIGSAFIQYKHVWSFFNGPGIIVVMAMFFGIELLVKKRQAKRYKVEEWLPLVDEKGRVLGAAPRSVVHNGSKLLHPVVHLHVIHGEKMLLQKRPLHKQVQPGKWDTSVGGHVSAGETVEAALKKETFEEVGLRNFKATLLATYVWESAIEREMVYAFVAEHKGPFTNNDGEVEELRFWTKQELKNALSGSTLTPNLVKELSMMGWL